MLRRMINLLETLDDRLADIPRHYRRWKGQRALARMVIPPTFNHPIDFPGIENVAFTYMTGLIHFYPAYRPNSRFYTDPELGICTWLCACRHHPAAHHWSITGEWGTEYGVAPTATDSCMAHGCDHTCHLREDRLVQTSTGVKVQSDPGPDPRETDYEDLL